VRIHSRIDETRGFRAETGVVATWCLPSQVLSASEELDGDGGERVVVLEDAAVAGVGVDDELGAGNAAVQVLLAVGVMVRTGAFA
jgi:hypothetical protein